MNEKEIIKFYHEKKIFYPRLEFIKDFLFYLLDTIDRTYLGDDLMTIQNKKEHYQYCINKTKDLFKGQNICINDSEDFDTFLFDVYFKFYYDSKKTKKNIEEFKMRISMILNYSLSKKQSQLDEMALYYNYFHKNLGNYLIF